jgi:hypothetical protein
MSFHRALSFCTVFLVASISPTPSKALDLPSGLFFGANLSEVQSTAQSQGWELDQSTFSFNAWSVDTEGLTFNFCDQMLTSVDQILDGGLRAFIETVGIFTLKYGEPDTDAFILSPRSRLETHGMESIFEPGQGMTISVQINSNDNKETVWTRKSDSSVCE